MFFSLGNYGGHAGTCLGILSNDCIVLAAERRNTNKLLDNIFHSEKIYKLNEDILRWLEGGIGNNWNSAESMLKQEYKEDETSLQDALDLYQVEDILLKR